MPLYVISADRNIATLLVRLLHSMVQGFRSMSTIILSLFVLFNTFQILSGRRVVKASDRLDFVASDWEQYTNSTSFRARRLDPVTPASHLVTDLPGLKDVHKIVHYAGHLTVDKIKGGNIFYWLIEAQTVDPLTGPSYLSCLSYNFMTFYLYLSN